MRFLVTLTVCTALAGCAASREQVAAQLGSQYVGQNVDQMVMKFGPPASTFRMNNGGASYQWQLTSVTDIRGGDGYGQASTRFCKVTVATNPAGIITQLNTEDSNAGAGIAGAIGAYGSICAQRMGIARS